MTEIRVQRGIPYSSQHLPLTSLLPHAGVVGCDLDAGACLRCHCRN
jgi:hypothetical protein